MPKICWKPQTQNGCSSWFSRGPTSAHFWWAKSAKSSPQIAPSSSWSNLSSWSNSLFSFTYPVNKSSTPANSEFEIQKKRDVVNIQSNPSTNQRDSVIINSKPATRQISGMHYFKHIVKDIYNSSNMLDGENMETNLPFITAEMISTKKKKTWV